MLRRYLVSLLVLLAVSSVTVLPLAVVTRAHVPAGQEMDEEYHGEFVLRINDNDYYLVKNDVLELIQKEARFIGTGALHITSSHLDFTTQDVSWSANKIRYRAPGAGLVAHVHWVSAKDAPDGAAGTIELQLPEAALHQLLPKPFTIDFHSGNYQVEGSSRVFREVAVHQSGVGLFLGRFLFAIVVALPIAITLHALVWFIILQRHRRKLAAANTGESLPRIFPPNPVAQWTWFTFTLMIGGLCGSFMSVMSTYGGFLSSSMYIAILCFAGGGFLIGLFVAWLVGRGVVTLKIDADSIAYARGKNPTAWITAHWSELKDVQCLSSSQNGARYEWVAITFPDGKKHKFSANSIADYPFARDTVVALFHHHRPTAS